MAKKNSAKTATATATSSANIGFEPKLWIAADKLRGIMDSGEYTHVVLALLFLKSISDAIEELHLQLKEGKGEFKDSDAEDADEYSAHNVFWVPKSARWASLQAKAKRPDVGKLTDHAMVAIEKYSPRLKGVFPKDYARPAIDKQRLGSLTSIGLGNAEHRGKDMRGRVYEYLLSKFAVAEGKSAMFVQSEKFVENHVGNIGDTAIYGQESNATTRRLAVMNLALRGIEADFGPEHADTFRRNLHPDRRADYILANPPFNDSDWFRKDDDVRWRFGVPPKCNANFARVEHVSHHLARQGIGGFVLANGGMSSNQSGEGEIRRALIEADLVDCIVALPDQLFYSTQIPVCLWFLTKNKTADAKRGFRDRIGTENQLALAA